MGRKKKTKGPLFGAPLGDGTCIPFLLSKFISFYNMRGIANALLER